MDNRPIGVFDSGIGGLSFVPYLIKVLPNEQIIYIGDTARAPYGSRSAEELKLFTGDIAQQLIDKGCKALAIACNTTSSTAAGELRKKYPKVPIVDVISPAAQYTAENCKSKRVGLIATEATVRSGAYGRLIGELEPSIHFYSKATPDFVPLIEAGKADSEEMDSVIRENLDDFIRINELDFLILGCTHYPYIADNLHRLYPKLALIDPSQAMAEKVKDILTKADMLSEKKNGEHQFFSTMPSPVFDRVVDKIKANC